MTLQHPSLSSCPPSRPRGSPPSPATAEFAHTAILNKHFPILDYFPPKSRNSVCSPFLTAGRRCWMRAAPPAPLRADRLLRARELVGTQENCARRILRHSPPAPIRRTRSCRCAQWSWDDLRPGWGERGSSEAPRILTALVTEKKASLCLLLFRGETGPVMSRVKN